MGDGQRLKAVLKEKGTNVRQVAKKAEVSPTTLYTIIQKDTDIKLDLGLRLAKVLGIPVSDISSFKVSQGLEILNQEKEYMDARGVLDLPDNILQMYFSTFVRISGMIVKSKLDIFEQYHFIDESSASDMRKEVDESQTRLFKKMDKALSERNKR